MGCRQTGALPRPEPAETGFVAVPRALSFSYLVSVAVSYPAVPLVIYLSVPDLAILTTVT